jgi:hypothetical protein
MFFDKPANLIKSLVVLSSVIGINTASAAITENSCTASPVTPPNGNVSRLTRELQRATNTGEPVVISGSYTLSSPIVIAIRKDLTVDATGASFTAANGFDGDMISLDIITNESNKCPYSNNRLANVSWTGGNFQFTDAKNSTTVPIQSRVPADRQGSEATGDALSIRGAYRRGSATTVNDQRINAATVDGVVMRGTTGAGQNFDDAGGDSGVFMSSVKHGIVINSEFYGIRDAAVYVSANNDLSTMRSQFTVTDNIIRRVFDGVSSKRGADQIVMRRNTITDSAVALSIKENQAGRVASNITIEDNTVIRSVRSILLENSRNVKVNDNEILELGGMVAGSNSPLGGNGRYRGIIMEGLTGTDNEANGNNFEAIASKTTVAFSNTKRGSTDNVDFTRRNNTYENIDERFRNE